MDKGYEERLQTKIEQLKTELNQTVSSYKDDTK